MKIIHIIPGSGGSFYCGNCLRDSKYVDAIRKLGHQVVKIPMYLPLFSDEHDIKEIPVFYGAVSIYLKQLYPVFRKAPGWFDHFLNTKPILKLAAHMAGSTRAKGLEDLTISMLLGEEGKQGEELERMAGWIADHCNPDIIHLSNALLLGLAHRLKEKLRVPIVCSLQDEDVWIDVMQPGIRESVWELMHKKAAYTDAFIAVSNFYAGIMKKSMRIPEEKVEILHLGVNPEDYQVVDITTKKRNIGFLSRLCFDNGLDIVVNAFIRLRKLKGFDDVRLILTGGYTGDDKKFIAGIRKRLKKENLVNDVEFHEDFEGPGRKVFFNKISILSVPVRQGEAFGMYQIEALASGVPVVQPALGAFPEIIELSGGGITYNPNTSEKLAETFAIILDDKQMLIQKSRDGLMGIKEHFHIKTQAGRMVNFYEKVIEQFHN